MKEFFHSVAAPLVRGCLIEKARKPVTLREVKQARAGHAAAVDFVDTPEGYERRFTDRLSSELNASGGIPDNVIVRSAEGEFVYETRVMDSYDACDRNKILSGKAALVTGGAQGFGAELVRGLLAGGALVFVADRNRAGAEALCEKLCREYGEGRAFPLELDVTCYESVRAMFERIACCTGGLDIAVSNAGVLKASSLLTQEPDVFKFVSDVNYTGFYHIAQHSALMMRRQFFGAPSWHTDIIQINSKSGLEGSNKNASYAGSKFGGIGLVQSYALELVEYNIKVNAICPGNFFNGPLWSDPDNGLFVQYLRSGKVPGAQTIADVRAFYENKVPMRRGCDGSDVMKALYYIVEQQYETGQAVPVTGGQLMLH